MTPLDIMMVRLLLAAAGSLAAGGAVWAVAVLCRRRLPALAQQRSPWLLGQIAVAAIFVAMLLPSTEAMRIVPVIDLSEPAAAPATTTAIAVQPTASLSVATAPTLPPAPRRHAWLRDAALDWCALYLLGLGHALYRWWRAQRLLNSLAASGQQLTTQPHAGTIPAMIEVEAPIAPMLQGLFKPRLLLPRHLRGFDPLQQQLIVEHELTHWRRHDLHWSAAALMLQSLFWFNPFMHMLGARLGWAQEFGCDRDVLRGRPQNERKTYAAALVAQLKLQQGATGMTLAFGANDSGASAPTLASRINLIRTPIATDSIWPRWLALGSLTMVATANLALQPALGWHPADVPDLAQVWQTSATAPATLDCFMMVDATSGATIIREGTCDERVTPASTFKIAISLMGFDSGVLQDARTPYLPYKQSYAAANTAWRHGTDPAGWLRESIVWYSQQVALRLGATNMHNYVHAFDYGNRDLASIPGVDDKIALSELSPTLKISPLEQIVFLRKVVNRSLPISDHAYDMTARLLKVDAPVNGWQVYGKTGTASSRASNASAKDEQGIGWFVGWTVRGGRTLVFARLSQYPAHTYDAGAQTRQAFLNQLARRTL